ncbi:MAG TPA: protein kinase [Candidatus Eisenbacteria bacterium]|nr:protein kinase [Candidatus Eisenbacteria bacterium]
MNPLVPGSKLGPYEIGTLLGAGGMGEVYRARDPRLGREVAVKVLPRAWAGDPERQQRFVAEARAAGSINHPNIVTLHDVGVADGAPYLVTEVLEGEALRAVIERGTLSPERAAEIVIQIAQGLAAAHAKGIVHRDLKPENLQVLPDGRVKILDFGIAKLTRTDSNPLAETTPVFASMTATGTILGTVSYMAPEQLRDKPVDHRADLFALGAIFHELLTGRQPFTGETAADRVSAILMAEPPALPATVETAMPGVEAVISKLLQKRPEGRFDSASDLAFILRLLVTRRAPAVGSTGQAEDLEPGAVRDAPQFRPLTFRDGNVVCSRFAPDGQTVVYQAAFDGKESEIFLSRVESPEARGLGLRNAGLQSVSRTAELAVTLRTRDFIGFVHLGTLARVPMIGGRPRELAEDVFMADWSPDGRELAVIRRVGAGFQLEAPLGRAIHSTTGWMSHPRYSPDGSRLSFFDHPGIGSNSGYVSVIRPGEAPRRLTSVISTLWRGAWGPSGEEIWFGAMGHEQGDGVFAVNLEGRVRRVYSSPGFAGVDDLNADGDALFITVQPRMRLETSTRAGGLADAVDLSWLDWSLLRDLTADGTMVLFDETGFGAGASPGIYIRSIDGEPAVRLGDGVCAAFSPDGRHVLAGQNPMGEAMVIPTGVGKPRRLRTEGLHVSYGDWLPDGREVVLLASEEGQGRRFYRCEIESGKVRLMNEAVIGSLVVKVSPDGSVVVGRGEDGLLALFPLDGSAPRPFAKLGLSYRPAGWAGDSRSFFVFRATEIPAKVSRVDAGTGAMEPWTEVTPLSRSGVDGINSMRFTPDGERYAYSYPRTHSVLHHARGLR